MPLGITSFDSTRESSIFQRTDLAAAFRRASGRTKSIPPVSSASASTTMRDARQALTSGIEALRNAFRNLARNIRRVSLPAFDPIAGTRARAQGFFRANETYSELRTTRDVTERVTSTRESFSPLGLETAAAERASTLASTEALGLDMTSAEARTILASSFALGLDTTSAEQSSRLVSTAEANTAQTSYSVVEARFAASTSVARIRGVYTGTGSASAATSLTIQFTSGAMQSGSSTAVSFSVKDQNNTRLFSYTGLAKAGDEFYLGDDVGLTISFTAGTISLGATSTFSVSRTTPTNVDPDALFNDADVNSRPRFENGAQVTAGGFTINGTAVQVFANDSINSVIDRINRTLGGITASFANDRLTIQSAGPSEDEIILGNDTSGFLAALKLTGAATTRGNVRDDLQVFSKTSRFSGLITGSFTVNGAVIALNPATDSLASLLAKINASGAGVTALYDPDADRVQLSSNSNSEDPISVDNDSTGFLAAAGLQTGNSVVGNVRDDRQSFSKTIAFASVVSGSFRINGVTILVDSLADTLQSIIQRINDSNAGVTASYDAASDRVMLATRASSEDEIVLQDDTSGFLAAARLTQAPTTRGNVRDDLQILSKTVQFGSVQAGTFRVNGVSISVDPAGDTLQSILARINSSPAGVSAVYDSATDRVRIAPPAGQPLALENDTTGFLAAAGIATGYSDTRVNPDAAFNGTGLNAPNFDDGYLVTSGEFTINGVTIQVESNDTLNTVLEKISASAAGVSASFDSEAERVVLTAKQPGARLVTLSADTSGFLAAAKLDQTAAFTMGLPGIDAPLSQIPAFAQARPGLIQINQRGIAIDPQFDKLEDLLARLNQLEEITASYNPEAGQFQITATRVGMHLDLQDSSGVLAALGITNGKFQGAKLPLTSQTDSDRYELVDPGENARELARGLRLVNEGLEKVRRLRDATPSLKNEISRAIRRAIASVQDEAGLGVAANVNSVVEITINQARLEASLRADPHSLDGILDGSNSLPDALENVINDNQAAFADPVPSVEPPAANPFQGIRGKIEEQFAKFASARQLFLIQSIAQNRPTPATWIPSHSLQRTYGLDRSNEVDRRRPLLDEFAKNRSERDVLNVANAHGQNQPFANLREAMFA